MEKEYYKVMCDFANYLDVLDPSIDKGILSSYLVRFNELYKKMLFNSYKNNNYKKGD